jgi:hypothetical protein
LSEGHIRTFRGAKADAEVAFAQFDGAVLAALREVESALVVYARDLDQRELLAAPRDQAAIAAADAEKLFRAGSTNYLTVLDANPRVDCRESVACHAGKIVDDQITLFLVMGSEWESPRLLAHKSIVTPRHKRPTADNSGQLCRTAASLSYQWDCRSYRRKIVSNRPNLGNKRSANMRVRATIVAVAAGILVATGANAVNIQETVEMITHSPLR